ncbi:MAG: TolC family protein [Bacteroidetes bacterium]|nr:TolC family protein [Bacteroidota bacterium]
MKRLSYLLPALVLFFIIPFKPLNAQKVLSFSLKEAQEYAFENNYSLRNSNYDVHIAREMVRQNTAIGLPQVDAGLDYMDYLNIPTTLIPGEFFKMPGTFQPIKFGLEYNTTVKAKITQLIYSGQYLVGLQTARAYLETSKQKLVKDKMTIRDQVAESYIGFLIIQESIRILDSTYSTISQMVNEAREIYKNGLIEDIDVSQLELNKTNLEATLISTKNQRLIAYNFLKFYMGVKEDVQIKLTDDLTFFLGEVNKDYLMNNPFDYNSNIDFKMLKKQEYLVLMQYKLAKTAYQPTLAGFLGTSANAQRNEWNFFDSKGTWYNTTNWGLSLTIPIWSSGSRRHSVAQARMNLEKMKVSEEQIRISLQLQVEASRNDFNKSYLVFNVKQQGLETATKIYERTIIKYRKGISTSTDLEQKYNQLLQAEGDYTQALFDLLKARIRLTTLLEKT